MEKKNIFLHKAQMSLIDQILGQKEKGIVWVLENKSDELDEHKKTNLQSKVNSIKEIRSILRAERLDDGKKNNS